MKKTKKTKLYGKITKLFPNEGQVHPILNAVGEYYGNDKIEDLFLFQNIYDTSTWESLLLPITNISDEMKANFLKKIEMINRQIDLIHEKNKKQKFKWFFRKTEKTYFQLIFEYLLKNDELSRDLYNQDKTKGDVTQTLLNHKIRTNEEILKLINGFKPEGYEDYIEVAEDDNRQAHEGRTDNCDNEVVYVGKL